MLHSYAYGTVVLKVSSLILRTREKAAGVKVWAPNWRIQVVAECNMTPFSLSTEVGEASKSQVKLASER